MLGARLLVSAVTRQSLTSHCAQTGPLCSLAVGVQFNGGSGRLQAVSCTSMRLMMEDRVALCVAIPCGGNFPLRAQLLRETCCSGGSSAEHAGGTQTDHHWFLSMCCIS